MEAARNIQLGWRFRLVHLKYSENKVVRHRKYDVTKGLWKRKNDLLGTFRVRERQLERGTCAYVVSMHRETFG